MVRVGGSGSGSGNGNRNVDRFGIWGSLTLLPPLQFCASVFQLELVVCVQGSTSTWLLSIAFISGVENRVLIMNNTVSTVDERTPQLQLLSLSCGSRCSYFILTETGTGNVRVSLFCDTFSGNQEMESNNPPEVFKLYVELLLGHCSCNFHRIVFAHEDVNFHSRCRKILQSPEHVMFWVVTFNIYHWMW